MTQNRQCAVAVHWCDSWKYISSGRCRIFSVIREYSICHVLLLLRLHFGS